MAIFCTDAGHGGPDTGAVWGGVQEKDLNLQVTLQLNQFLKERGHRVFTTRKSDQNVPPLRTRCKLINLHHQNNKPSFDAIISIHCNVAAYWDEQKGSYVPIPEQHGLYVIYSAESEAGRHIAQSIAEACTKNDIDLAHEGMLSTKELGRRLCWIHQTKPPAVLVELGFLTNPDELVLLQDATYQQKLILAITQGLEQSVVPLA